MAHNHDIPLLSGPIPGLLDPSQASRLLRTPTCSLFFAAFDPLTARAEGFPNLSELHIDPGSSSKRVNLEATASANGKRVVIETDPEGSTCSWRFVPRAKIEDDGMDDEGFWPRIVELCGRHVRMTQDQWDIHKLDPMYDCIVRIPPNFTTISWKKSTQPDTTTTESPRTPKAMPVSVDDTPTPTVKRSISPASQDAGSPRKRAKATPASSADSDKMSVDDDVSYRPPPPNAPEGGKKRRRVLERLDEASTSHAGKAHKESAGPSVFANLPSNPRPRRIRADYVHRDDEEPPAPPKRFRTRSPEAIRREMGQKRADREKKRQADQEMRLKQRRDDLHKAFWKDIGIIPTAPDEDLHSNQSEPNISEAGDSSDDPRESTSENESDAEAERLAKIEQSRQKLAELEKDKPLWEESARKRQEREMEERRARDRARAMREEQERFEERAKAARRQREDTRDQQWKQRERDARRREQSARMHIPPPRNVFRWSSRQALERYMQTASDFDAAKFSSGGEPLSFASVPWPVLPMSFSVQDIDWDAVEAFFGEVQRLLMPAEFKELIEKSHRRFHPDRWRSRGLLVSVNNETERDLLEVAGSTVAQAITPLWKEVAGR